MAIVLDDRDVRILAILSQDGRISKTELARRVNLSMTPCWARLKRLEQSGLIRGYRAEIAVEKLASTVTIFVAAELESHRAADFQQFERAIQREEQITGCWAVGGGFDYILQVIAADIDGYQRLMDELLSDGIGLKRYYSYVMTKQVKTGVPPLELLMGHKKN